MIGTTISHYRVLATAGVGGMGVVYLAEDTRLHRKVALKFLPPSLAADTHARSRFQREAQSASALDHPNLATIFEIGDWQDQLFIAMAFYEGETLRARLGRGPLPVADAVAILRQLAIGLAAAHRAGIVHRDLKPANIMLTHDGHVKILDFGLAKATSDGGETATALTGRGTTVGTVAYMAPEQAQGAEVDARADIWSLGVIGYEMLTGRLPFRSDNAMAALLSLASDTPVPLGRAQPSVPAEIVSVIDRTLEKSPERRTLTAEAIAEELSAWQARASASHIAGRPARPSRGRALIISAAIVLLVLAGAFAWFWRQGSRARWAREEAVPQIERLVEQEKFVAAFRLAGEARRVIPTDPVWNRLEPIISRTVSVETTPPGASVSYREYGAPDSEWIRLGETPIKDAHIPAGFVALHVEKSGFVPADDVILRGFLGVAGTAAYTLNQPPRVPEGMVFVSASSQPFQMFIPGLDHLPSVKLQDFWIDKFEVTNRQYKKFVDAGGYQQAKFWREPFSKDDRRLTSDEAMRTFVDATGRPGPAAWEGGSFPEGQDDFPVTGVSWYEAAAYAEYAGKSLPTIYHWSRVAEQRTGQVVVPRSNFGGRGPVKVGSTGGLNRFGAFDLAGNVKEWCWNRADASKRYILGGGWDEPVYMFNDPDARSPFERGSNFGFRLVQYAPDEPLARADAELVAFEARDFAKEKPATDAVFEAYRRLYAYDKRELQAAVDSVDESNPDWRREKISFAAAYGDERVPAFLYLPKTGNSPYQTVVFFPGSNALQQRSSAQINTRFFDWILKSGRAVIHPIYKSTFERGDGVQSDYPSRTSSYREHTIAWSQDVGRSIDYLETRPEIDKDRIAYMGFSWGAAMAPIYIAVEPRFKTALLILGGFYLQHSAPEVDGLNFAPRVKVPVLLLNGRYDFFFPMDTSQLPMFTLFAAPDSQKRRVIYDTGHNIPRAALIRETLDWLDHYLGPAQSR